MDVNATAFLIHQNTLYFTTDTHFPVGSLIEGIWTQYPEQARTLTRHKALTFKKPSPLCEGMLKVVGKRINIVSFLEFESIFNSHEGAKIKVELQLKLSPLPDQFKKKQYSKEEAISLVQELAQYSRLKIAAILLNDKNELVSWGWNDHAINKTLHAELMLVKNFLVQFEKKIPKNYTLISTLQPCAMCAGYIHGHAEDFQSLKIIYLKNDPGPKAQNSILVEGSDLWKKHYR